MIMEQVLALENAVASSVDDLFHHVDGLLEKKAKAILSALRLLEEARHGHAVDLVSVLHQLEFHDKDVPATMIGQWKLQRENADPTFLHLKRFAKKSYGV